MKSEEIRPIDAEKLYADVLWHCSTVQEALQKIQEARTLTIGDLFKLEIRLDKPKEPLQKPLTLDEVKALDEDEECYFDETEFDGFYTGHVSIEHKDDFENVLSIGSAEPLPMDHKDYGKTWLIWNHEPTEEEKKQVPLKPYSKERWEIK